jgi:glycosyltransferase involved in cell wall biosynthesis
MKILLAVHYPFNPNAGASGVVWQLGQRYQKWGHQVEYYSFDNLPQSLPYLAKVVLFPEFLARHIGQLCHQQAIDVVDASTGDTWFWTTLLKQLSNHHPLIVTRDHGLEYIEHLGFLEDVKLGKRHLSWKYPLYRGSIRLWEEAQSLRNADLCLFLNHQDLKYATDQLQIDAKRAQLIANGIPESFLNLDWQPITSEKDINIKIAIVGTYIPRKGIHYTVPPLNKILVKYPHVSVSFLGTECKECPDSTLIYQDFEPTVHKRVQVIPRYQHHNLPNLLKGHHIKLFASTSEGFGMALVEAMACGLAPITTATPGPLEIVTDGEDALVIPVRDSDAIEQALEKLLNNHTYLDQLRQKAYETAQQYSWDILARQTLAFYQTALQLTS